MPSKCLASSRFERRPSGSSRPCRSLWHGRLLIRKSPTPSKRRDCWNRMRGCAVDQMLDGLEQTSSRLAQRSTPPLDVAGLERNGSHSRRSPRLAARSSRPHTIGNVWARSGAESAARTDHLRHRPCWRCRQREPFGQRALALRVGARGCVARRSRVRGGAARSLQGTLREMQEVRYRVPDDSLALHARRGWAVLAGAAPPRTSSRSFRRSGRSRPAPRAGDDGGGGGTAVSSRCRANTRSEVGRRF